MSQGSTPSWYDAPTDTYNTYSQEDYYDAVDAIFDDIFTNPLIKKEKQ